MIAATVLALALSSEIHPMLATAPTKPTAEEASEPLPEAPPLEDPTDDADQRWYDKAHNLLSASAQDSALWFDDFFGPSEEADQASSHFRLRLQQRMFERESNEFKVRVSASYYLPNTEKRLKLLVESDPDSELTELRDGQSEEGDGGARAALRWIPLDFRRWDLSFDIGVQLDSGLDPFARTRARYFYSFDERTVMKFSQEFKAEVQDGWSETSRLTLERIFSRSGYRLHGRAKYGEQTEGLEWSTTFVRAQRLDTRSALATFVSASGQTKDEEEQSEIYRLGANYRRNFLRSWLFYEIEPQLTWPRKYDYVTNLELRLTLEVQFGNWDRERDRINQI
ncbi:hypothetical protein [Ferrimonas balearica]|uniref:hypothetical protein n=1 Tax=Ferrimonas balearica TaxID=44012 RepID=UPI001C5795BE|nr:hypothetical protein [Ferrimonas balearica]MBW3141106.1 hypothetical protein [Ferrimonas balearica]MBY6107870.1 hypothetical protein [Ferrimonas balearica]MBY6225211.1 hypothetical protein [Ferrimonas balearica]